LAGGDVGGDGEGSAARVGDVFLDDEAGVGLDVGASLDLDGDGSARCGVSDGEKTRWEGGEAHPLDGLAQVMVNGWPAVAWMPDGGLLMTLLLLPCAATRAANARTSGTQGRIVDGVMRLDKNRSLIICRLWCSVVYSKN
jgi:hypothetical protein